MKDEESPAMLSYYGNLFSFLFLQKGGRITNHNNINAVRIFLQNK